MFKFLIQSDKQWLFAIFKNCKLLVFTVFVVYQYFHTDTVRRHIISDTSNENLFLELIVTNILVRMSPYF